MDGNDCRNNQDCGSNADENRRERRMRSGDGDDNDGRRARSRDRDNDEDRVGRNNEDRRDARQRDRREARNWRYDPNHHRRSRHRDSTFRFYFGGYYYPERYWDGPTIVIGSNNRVSCGEGRDIVDDNGFNRVRTVECSGRNYTYTGRRQGDTFRIVLNSRTGRIVSVRAL